MDISQSVTSPLHNSSATVSPHPTPALPPPISHLPAPRCPENYILRRCLTTLTLPMPSRPDTHPPQSLLPRCLSTLTSPMLPRRDTYPRRYLLPQHNVFHLHPRQILTSFRRLHTHLFTRASTRYSPTLVSTRYLPPPLLTAPLLSLSLPTCPLSAR